MWAMFQLTFAIITPALIIGAIAERMKFSAVLLFVALWMFAVYFPLAHMVWAHDGFMCGPLNPNAGIKAHRLRGRHRRAHDLRLERAGALPDPRQAPRLRQGADAAAQHGACAWSAPACSGSAGMASMPARRWLPTASPQTPSRPPPSPPPPPASSGRWRNGFIKGKPSVLGFCSGIVAGLVVITPACGFVRHDGRRDHRRARRRHSVLRCASSSRRCSATTTRSTRSASTASAARWAPSSPASSRDEEGQSGRRPRLEGRPGHGADQSHRRHDPPLRRRHGGHRLHRQSGHRPAPGPRESKPPVSTSASTASRVTNFRLLGWGESVLIEAGARVCPALRLFLRE